MSKPERTHACTYVRTHIYVRAHVRTYKRTEASTHARSNTYGQFPRRQVGLSRTYELDKSKTLRFLPVVLHICIMNSLYISVKYDGCSTTAFYNIINDSSFMYYTFMTDWRSENVKIVNFKVCYWQLHKSTQHAQSFSREAYFLSGVFSSDM